jgi:hypothetical protein
MLHGEKSTVLWGVVFLLIFSIIFTVGVMIGSSLNSVVEQRAEYVYSIMGES